MQFWWLTRVRLLLATAFDQSNVFVHTLGEHVGMCLYVVRHVDTVLLCTIYGVCKVNELPQEVKFKDVIAHYKRKVLRKNQVRRRVVTPGLVDVYAAQIQDRVTARIIKLRSAIRSVQRRNTTRSVSRSLACSLTDSFAHQGDSKHCFNFVGEPGRHHTVLQSGVGAVTSVCRGAEGGGTLAPFLFNRQVINVPTT